MPSVRADASETPLISIGMPVWNNERSLAQAVRSILWQSYAHWELLIADDGSSDASVRIARHFADARIRVLQDGLHRGLPARLNEVVAHSRGPYFARMDGDDISYPRRLEHQLLYLQEHPEVDLLATGILVFDDEGRALGTRAIRQSHAEICRRPWAGFYLPHPTWMGKTAWFRRHPYPLQAQRMEDQELLLRTHRSSQFACLPQVLLGYRESSFSLRKALPARYNLIRLIAREPALCCGHSLSAPFAIAEHAWKALAECAAACSGRPYWMLRHRALPVDEATLGGWREVASRLGLAAAGASAPPGFSLAD